MKKILFTVFIVLSTSAFAKPIVVVSILPQKTFVEKIAKEMVDITVMVAPGSSPHAYEPKSSQMVSISKADVYFSIGVEFENVWIDKFKAQNPKLKFVNLSDQITKIKMSEHHHEEEHKKDKHEEHEHSGLDPHTWTSPKNVAIMAQSIYKTLARLDPKNEQFYKANLDNFLKEIEDTDRQIKEALKDMKPNSKFMVFHPSWGYFAHEYGLTQIAVEVDGKNPKPKEMITIIEEAKEEKVRAIFTQPEFSDKSAKIIAKEVGVRVEIESPMAADWSSNLIKMAKAIAN
ncbi:MAG: zinc ABC transporter substrate-binding protein [Sulfurimonas sp.]|nr:zinc ABC transporter substrate-binding protein [Sulfurimonas sp.]